MKGERIQSRSRRDFDRKRDTSSIVEEKAKEMEGGETWKFEDFLIKR